MQEYKERGANPRTFQGKPTRELLLTHYAIIVVRSIFVCDTYSRFCIDASPHGSSLNNWQRRKVLKICRVLSRCRKHTDICLTFTSDEEKKRVIHGEIYSFAQVGPLQKAVVFLLSKAIHFTAVSPNRRTIIQSALTLSHSLDSPERSLQVNKINNHFKCIYHQALHAVLSKLHVSPTKTFPSLAP